MLGQKTNIDMQELKAWKAYVLPLYHNNFSSTKHSIFTKCRFELWPSLQGRGTLHEYCSKTLVYRHVSHLWGSVSDHFWPKTEGFVNLLWLQVKSYCNETNSIQKFHSSIFYVDFFRFIYWLEVFLINFWS